MTPREHFEAWMNGKLPPLIHHQFRDGECWCSDGRREEPDEKDYARRMTETNQRVAAQMARKAALAQGEDREKKIQENMRKSIMGRKWGE